MVDRQAWARSSVAITPPLALYAIAWIVRWQIVGSPTYGDEGQHWFHASHWLERRAHNIADPYGATWFHPWWAMLQRPLWYAFYMPWAEMGFTHHRIAHLTVTSLLPVAGYGLLRSLANPRWIAALAGLLVAVHPTMVTWSALLLMDADMTLLLAGALWARVHRRYVLAGSLLLASIWVKETALFAAIAWLAWEGWRAWLHGGPRDWPLPFTRPIATAVPAVLLGLAPVLVASSQGLRPPGGPSDPYPLRVIEEAFASAWLVPVLIVGLRFKATRLPAAAALLFGALFVAINLAGRQVELWYTLVSVFFTLIAVPVVALAAWQAWKAPIARAASVAGVIVAVALVVVPSSLAGTLHPLTGDGRHNLPEAVEWEREFRDADLRAMMAAMALQGNETVVTVDVFYPLVLHPISQQAGDVVTVYPWFIVFFNSTREPVARAIDDADWLLVHHIDYPSMRRCTRRTRRASTWSRGGSVCTRCQGASPAATCSSMHGRVATPHSRQVETGHARPDAAPTHDDREKVRRP